MNKKFIAVMTATVLFCPAICVNADFKEDDLKSAANEAISWKNGNDSPFYSIGSNSSNLYITALKSLGRNYDYSSYLSGMDGIAAGYGSEHNVTDMQRSAIAVYAADGDAQNVGNRDLIADCTYFRDETAPLDRDGVNGLSWALIALDSNDYSIPSWALRDRDQIIAEILSRQNTNGSFDDDVYTTASAITALAPYAETSGAYSITQYQTGWSYDISPADAINGALDFLSSTQELTGDWGNLNATAMTVIALDALGINIENDNRFIKSNGDAIDGLMSYKNRDGGFAYTSGDSDGEATSYAICAIASHLRNMQDKEPFFRLGYNDPVVFETPSPAPTERPAATPAPTARPAATPAASNTTRSATSSATSTPNIKATTAPRTTPANTMRATKTAAPAGSGAPSSKAPATTKPTASPRPTKRPDLVGPVLMPGPMQPMDAPAVSNENNGIGSKIPIAPIAVSLLAILAAIAAVLAIALKRTGSAAASKATGEIYKAKRHRRGEEHRRYETRERYKQRLKYKKKR